MNKIYIAGPMTGIPQFNFPMFDTFRDLYTELEYEVFSPADHDRRLLGRDLKWLPTEDEATENWKSWKKTALADPVNMELPDLRAMLGADLKWICANATHIAMIPGWEKSNGARAEHATAVALGLQIHYYPIPNDIVGALRAESRPGLVR